MPQQTPPMGNDMSDGMGGIEDGSGEELDLNSEELDPKKEIQQLTGKLSQALRKYNDEQSEPDSELNKYVAGMLAKQFSKSLTTDDKEDVIKKINSNSDTDDLGNDGSDDNLEMNQQDDSSMDMQNEPPMESKHNIGKLVNEIANSIVNHDDDKKERHEKKTKVKSKINPFLSNR